MKKVVLILDSWNKIFPQNRKVLGGANRVAKYLIEYWLKLANVSLDIICSDTIVDHKLNVNNIYALGFCPFANNNLFFEKANEIIEKNNYDVILTTDLYAPFGNLLVHSHTPMYKSKNCKNFFVQFFLKFLKRAKIKKFKNSFENKNRKIFTVSKKLAKDYIENAGFLEKNVISVYPGVDFKEKNTYFKNEVFTFGIISGNAINKGGYLFLFALFFLKLLNFKFRAKILLSKSNKSYILNGFIKFLNLKKEIDIVSGQINMDDFYKIIDCLVVPSVNEAFGLVVTEASSYNKPSLVSSTAGSAEIIENNINGFVFERKSCVLISLFNLISKMKYILKLNENEFKKISNNAYELSLKYTWDNFCEKISEELNLFKRGNDEA